MAELLNNSRNALTNPLAVRDRYGAFQVGGGIGWRDIANQLALKPQTAEAANALILDVAPGTAQMRSLDRFREQYQAYQDATSPITKALRAADMGLEGGGLAADIIPGAAATAAAVGGLVPFMARNVDPLADIMRRQAGIIGSTGAKTADLDALKVAQDLKASGVDADDIFDQTGWWLDHPDGRPRFEIDDSGREWGEGFYNYATEGERLHRQTDFLDHPELYEAYPEMDKTGVIVGDLGSATGNYSPSDNLVTLNKARFGKNDMQSTNLHELQHAIQQREGMARGGSPDPIFKVDKRVLKNIRDVELPELRRKVNNAATQEEYFVAKRNLDNLARFYDEHINPFQTYRRLAGEAEARLVQDRMNLTPLERAAKPFYKEFDVPLEDQIVRMDGGVAESLPTDEASRMARAREMGFGDDLYHASQQDITEFKPGYDDGLIFLTPNPEMANQWAGLGKFRGRVGAEDEIKGLEKSIRDAKARHFDYELLNKLEGDEFHRAYDEKAKSWYEGTISKVRAEDAYKTIYPVRTNVKNTFDPRRDYEKIEGFLKELPGMQEALDNGYHKAGNWVIYERPEVVSKLKEMGYDSMLLAENIGGPHETLAVFDPSNIRSRFAQFDPAKRDSANILAGGAGAALGLNVLADRESNR